MSSCSNLFARLSSVNRFFINVSSDNKWLAAGRGRVEVQSPNCAELIWRESGCWDENLNHLEFSNVYRWNRINRWQVQLEHLRYGVNNPVQLVALQSNRNNSWSSNRPYLCAKDEYNLNLDIQDDQVVMNWRIKGPEKNQTSTIYYT